MIEHIRNITDYLLSPTDTLRDAMSRLSSGRLQHQFQIVADGDRRLLGTLLDGDIRRGLLAGAGLDDPVSRCMKRNPATGRAGEQKANVNLLHQVVAQTTFLPILDESDVIQEILVGAGPVLAGFRALVMAGGLGSRLGERTRKVPKPLLPVGGKPVLEHILTRLEAASVDDVYVSVHYLADSVDSFLQSRNNKVRVQVLREDDPLGTTGAMGLLPPDTTRDIMVVNGDILTSLDLVAFLDFHQKHQFDATIAVAQHLITIPYGVVRHDKDGQFLGIEEKPTLTNFVAAGIYLLSPQYHALIRPGEKLDMPELLNRGQSMGLSSTLFPIHEYWMDLGKPEDLERAELAHAGGRTPTRNDVA